MKNFALKLSLVFAAAIALSGCTDDSSFEVLEDTYGEAREDAYADYRSTIQSLSSSSYSSATNSSSSNSSSSETESSSSSSAYSYTIETKTIYFKLYSYKQTSASWDGTSSTNYSDGDPEVSFEIHCISAERDTTTLSTGLLLDLDNVGSWSGYVVYTGTVPVGTQKISICPEVIDEDTFFDDTRTSGYCFSETDIGYLEDYETISQSDTSGGYYALYWSWYLY